MRLRSMAPVVILLLARSAFAQPSPEQPAPPNLGPPMLHLSASAIVKVGPDELVADLRGGGVAPTPAVAQRHVNELMAKAKAAVAGVAGVKTAFQDYSVSLSDEKPARWTAQQSLEIRSGEGGAGGEAVLDLVGRLQGLGLALDNLGWQVSRNRAEGARQEATLKALKALRKQASDAAAALGMEVDHIQAVALNEPPGVIPMAQRGMAAAPAMTAMPPPNTTREDQDVTATATADVVLRITAIQGRTP